MAKRNKQYIPRTKNTHKEQVVPMKELRQQCINEFMEVPERLHYCIGCLQTAHALFSIGNVYIETINDMMLKHDIFLPHLKRTSNAIVRAFDLFKNETDKLFKGRGDKREFGEYIAQLQEDIEKMVHLDEDEERMRQAEKEYREKLDNNND